MAILDTWKESGWWALIYIAAILNIPESIHEAAMIDGAGRFIRIIKITLPSIIEVIAVVFVLNIGGMLNGGISSSNFEQGMLFGNALNQDTSRILDKYVVQMGFELGRFSFATAIGLVHSLLSLILFLTANKITKKLTSVSIY